MRRKCVLSTDDKRFIRRILTRNHACEMPDLKLNTTKIGRFLVACRVLEGLLHPSVVSLKESIQRFLGKTDTFVRLLKILGADAIVVNDRKHVSIDNNLSELLH